MSDGVALQVVRDATPGGPSSLRSPPQIELTPRASFPKVRPSLQAHASRRKGGNLGLDRESVLDGASVVDLGVPARPPGGDGDLGPPAVPDPPEVRACGDVLHAAAGSLAILGDVRSRSGA